MKYQIGDRVRVKSCQQIMKSFGSRWLAISSMYEMARFCGEECKVISVNLSGGDFYILEGVPGIWHEDWLEPVEESASVSVDWDLSRDLSITQAQYEKICCHAEKTGRTTTEVLRMLVAAAMETFLCEGEEDHAEHCCYHGPFGL